MTFNEFIARRVTYEWRVEILDDYGDITDSDEYESFQKACEAATGPADCIVLVRDAGSHDQGIDDRQWAYYDRVSESLPLEFDGGAVVPQRFFKETA
jgi:hypothetical protein